MCLDGVGMVFVWAIIGPETIVLSLVFELRVLAGAGEEVLATAKSAHDRFRANSDAGGDPSLRGVGGAARGSPRRNRLAA
jgi:hypothetical protein